MYPKWLGSVPNNKSMHLSQPPNGPNNGAPHWLTSRWPGRHGQQRHRHTQEFQGMGLFDLRCFKRLGVTPWGRNNQQLMMTNNVNGGSQDMQIMAYIESSMIFVFFSESRAGPNVMSSSWLLASWVGGGQIQEECFRDLRHLVLETSDFCWLIAMEVVVAWINVSARNHSLWNIASLRMFGGVINHINHSWVLLCEAWKGQSWEC